MKTSQAVCLSLHLSVNNCKIHCKAKDYLQVIFCADSVSFHSVSYKFKAGNFTWQANVSTCML